MKRLAIPRPARTARLIAAAAFITACSADPSTSFAPGLAIDPPTGYPNGVDGNCLPNLTDDLSRVCWLSQYTAGTRAPLDSGDSECKCVGGTIP